MNRITRLAACTLALAACKNVIVDSEQPATLSDPTNASRTALQSAVNEAMHTEVLLAPDVLTETSLLIIERKARQSIDGMPTNDRTGEMPVQFRLVTNGVDCILVDQRDRAEYVLANTTCRADVSRD